ncbi:MAG: PilN domain-containing protein [Coriobacteriia bacterium]|nr:PilN domain-containing protein [Coriobacteriia bacterium]
MMRINLLPPEILERRKAEKRMSWVIIAAIGIAVLLVGVWALGFFQLQGKRDELASVQQEVQSTNAQAGQLAIFEERAAELDARRATADLAFSERRNWSKLFQELSLVLPPDVWVQMMTVEEASGLSMSGFAVDAPADSPDLGFKSMAKMLVRLADLEQLSDVWLTTSQRTVFAEQDALQFSVTASVSATGSDTP